MTTIILQLHNAGFFNIGPMLLGRPTWSLQSPPLPLFVVLYLLGMGIFYGGLMQIVAGLMAFMRNDTFGATAFLSYGAFWEVRWWLFTDTVAWLCSCFLTISELGRYGDPPQDVPRHHSRRSGRLCWVVPLPLGTFHVSISRNSFKCGWFFQYFLHSFPTLAASSCSSALFLPATTLTSSSCSSPSGSSSGSLPLPISLKMRTKRWALFCSLWPFYWLITGLPHYCWQFWHHHHIVGYFH